MWALADVAWCIRYGVTAPPAAGAVMIAAAILLMQIKVKWQGDKADKVA